MWTVTRQKIWALMCYSCQKYIMFEPKKITEELCVITLKNGGKFEEELLTCTFKNDMRNFANIDPTFRCFKICPLIGSFWSMFELKNYKLCVMTLKGDAIFKEKLTGSLKNYIRNLINFYASSHKSENLHFDELILSKAHKVLDRCAEVLCLVTLKSDLKKS